MAGCSKGTGDAVCSSSKCPTVDQSRFGSDIPRLNFSKLFSSTPNPWRRDPTIGGGIPTLPKIRGRMHTVEWPVAARPRFNVCKGLLNGKDDSSAD